VLARAPAWIIHRVAKKSFLLYLKDLPICGGLALEGDELLCSRAGITDCGPKSKKGVHDHELL
jgi:hypothetical protein